MGQVNCVVVEGNITRLPEVKTSPNGFPICKIPIAVNRRYKNSVGEDTEEVSFFDVEAFGKLADLCSKFAEKGRGVSVVGRMKQSRWKSEDGKANSRVTIVAEHVEFKPKLRKETVQDYIEEKNEEAAVEEAAVTLQMEKENVF